MMKTIRNAEKHIKLQFKYIIMLFNLYILMTKTTFSYQQFQNYELYLVGQMLVYSYRNCYCVKFTSAKVNFSLNIYLTM